MAAMLDGARGPGTAAKYRELENKMAKLSTLAVNGKGTLILHPSAVQKHVRDLRGTLSGDVDAGRTILSKLVGRVVLRPEGHKLVAEIGGNLPGLLGLEEFGKSGAGREVLELSPRRVRVA